MEFGRRGSTPFGGFLCLRKIFQTLKGRPQALIAAGFQRRFCARIGEAEDADDQLVILCA